MRSTGQFLAAVFRVFCWNTNGGFHVSFSQVDILILLADALISLFKRRGNRFEAQVKADTSCSVMRPFAKNNCLSIGLFSP